MGTTVIALSVQCSRVHARKKSGNKSRICNFSRIVIYLNNFGMTCIPIAYTFIIGIRVCSSGITGYSISYTFQTLKNNFRMPETSFTKSCYCFFRAGIALDTGRNNFILRMRLCTRIKSGQ